MITNKKELKFYIMADRIMNGWSAYRSLTEQLRGIITIPVNGKIIEFLRYMRKSSYYHTKENPSIIDRVKSKWYGYRFSKISLKLGFSIGRDVFGYGLVIPHYGTIVVNNGVRAGNYCVLHTSTCIGGANKTIGDGLYLASGAKIMGDVNLGNGVSVAAGSLVNKSYGDNVLIAGMPGIVVRDNYPIWYQRDGLKYEKRVEKIEELKIKMQIR